MYSKVLLGAMNSLKLPATFIAMIMLLQANDLYSQPWYTQGNFSPAKRIAITLTNTLKIERKDVPVAIQRGVFPFADFHDLDVTIVDPVGEPRPEPGTQQLGNFGVHEIRGEHNGRMIFHQLDDLDKDGFGMSCFSSLI